MTRSRNRPTNPSNGKRTRRDFLKLSLAVGGWMLLGRAGLASAGPAGGAGKVTGGGKKLLILGGTSFVGPALVEAAKKRGYVLTLFNRGKTNPGMFTDIEQLHGDRKTEAGLAVLKGRKWDAVIDTSGYFPKDVGASAGLLKDNVKQYVFISTISTYKDSRTPIDESSPLAELKGPIPEKITGESYGALKVLCEQEAEKAFPKRTLIIRPGYIVGPGDPTDRFTYWPLRALRGGEMLAPGAPGDPVQIIDVRDLAEWTLQMIDKSQVGIYNAVGPKDKLGMGEMLESCKAAAGTDVRFTWVPDDFLEKQKVDDNDLPIWVAASSSIAGLAQTSNQRAVAAGLVFRPVVDTARDTIAWWKTLPPERQAKQRAGMKPEREAEVLAAWHKEHPAPAAAAPTPGTTPPATKSKAGRKGGK
jgi:2'-hydroxyisoflavone reductase